jgi:hypothetical protein
MIFQYRDYENEIRTKNNPNTYLDRYFYTNIFGEINRWLASQKYILVYTNINKQS